MKTPNKQHQANSRARRAAQGLVRVEVWVPEEHKEHIRERAGECVEWGERSKRDAEDLAKAMERAERRRLRHEPLAQTKDQSDE